MYPGQAVKAWVRRWGLPIFWMGLILVLSSDVASSENTAWVILPLLQSLFLGLSPETYQLLHGAVRKGAHLIEYGVLSLLWARAIAGPGRRWMRRAIWGAVGISVLWAIVDETHQGFVPSRTESATDVGFDIVGAVLAQVLRLLFARRPTG